MSSLRPPTHRFILAVPPLANVHLYPVLRLPSPALYLFIVCVSCTSSVTIRVLLLLIRRATFKEQCAL